MVVLQVTVVVGAVRSDQSGSLPWVLIGLCGIVLVVEGVLIQAQLRRGSEVGPFVVSFAALAAVGLLAMPLFVGW